MITVKLKVHVSFTLACKRLPCENSRYVSIKIRINLFLLQTKYTKKLQNTVVHNSSNINEYSLY